MVVGLLQFELFIHGSVSLKDKRRVLLSIKDRLHREHQVSVAEVASQDSLNHAVLGLACVGADGARVAEVLDRILAKLRALTDAEIGGVSRQVLHGSTLFDDPGDAPDPADAALAAELLRHADAPDPPAQGPTP